MVSIIFSFYFYIFKLNLKTLSSCVSVDKLVDSVWDSLLELIEVSASDEVETSLVEGSLELEFVDELAWARVSGTTTKMVATIKDNEKYPNRLRR
jgi:hypothetical protein